MVRAENFQKIALGAGVSFSPLAKKKVFEVKLDLKNLLSQATEHRRVK